MTKKYIQDFKSKLSNGVTLAPEELQDFFSRLEGDLKDKKYGLVWESQTEQVIAQLKANKVYLEEEQDLKITQDPDNPKSNILIEGDNYEALTYLNEINQKVDVIYIDPPYNTGNKDFIYNDRFIDKEDGFRHSQWLSFMDARLRLARELLTDDGLIFISIDDNELYQLKLLCDHIFGEENFISNIIWKKQGGGKQDSKYLANNCEYVLTYRKSNSIKNFKGKKLEDKIFNKIDDKGRRYRLMSMDFGSLRYSRSLDYPIQLPNGEVVYPGGDKKKHIKRLNGEHSTKDWTWRCSEAEFKRRLDKGDIEFTYNKNTKRWKVQEKLYWDENKTTTHENLITDFTNRTGNNQIVDLFGEKAFSYPKPTNLIYFLVALHPNPNAIVLDFFAGSGTTGHAVLELNKEDGGNRQFILVTNNENNIARDVTYERNKRVIEGYTTPKGKDVSGTPSNLAYYKTKQISKYDIDFDEVMLQHIIPTIQFTEGVYHHIRHSGHILQLGDNIFIFNQYMVEDDEIDTLVGLVKDGDILYIQEGQVDYIKSKLPEGVVYKYLEDVLPTNR